MRLYAVSYVRGLLVAVLRKFLLLGWWRILRKQTARVQIIHEERQLHQRKLLLSSFELGIRLETDQSQALIKLVFTVMAKMT